MNRNGGSDLEVVWTAELGPIITGWRAAWDANRPYVHQWKTRMALERRFVTALDYLSVNAEVAKRKINAIQAQQYRFTALGVADRLLVVMNLEHLLDDGTIHVVPNPSMSLEHWLRRMAERGCVEL